MGAFDDLIPGGKKPAGGAFDDLIPTKPKSRGLLSVANDTVIELANAAAGGVKSVGDFVAPGNAVSAFIDENIIKAGEANQSDVVKAEKARYRSEMEAAEGIGDEVGSTLGYVARNPLQSLAQAAGSFAIPGAAVKGAGMLGSAAGLGVKGSINAGLAGGAVAGAALSGGDAAGTAYELVKRAGGTDAEATQAARKASVLPAAIGAAGGVIGAERLLAGAGGFKGGMLSRALKTAGVEGAQEAVEEGVTQYEGQRAAMPFDPSINPMKGVAGAATMGAVLGAATGGGVSLLTGEHQQPKPTVADVLGAPSIDDAINKSMAMLALPAPSSGVADELVDGVLSLSGPSRTAAPQMLRALPAPDGGTIYMADDKGNVAPQPAAARAEAVTRAAEADIATTQQRLADRQQQTDLGVTPGLRKAQDARIEGDLQREPIPVGEVTEVLPTGEAQEFEVAAAGEATEFEVLPVGEILDGDLMAKDGEPYASKTGAQARAFVSGGKIVTVPDHFGAGQAGYVVRPVLDVRPNNTRGTTAADVLRKPNEPVPDMARIARGAVGPADGSSDQRSRSGGAVRPVTDGAGPVLQRAEPPASGNAAPAVVADGSGQPAAPLTPGSAGTALTTGDSITLAGKSYAVSAVKPTAVTLDDGAGNTRMVATNSKTFAAITKDDAQPTTTTPRIEAPAPPAATAADAAAARAAGGAVEANGLAAGFNYKAFNAMPEGLGKTARKLGDAIMGRDAAAMADILSPSNKRSRAAFESLFSGKVKLPATVNGTRAVVDDFLSKVSAGINAAPVATAPAQADSGSAAPAPAAPAPAATLADRVAAKRAKAPADAAPVAWQMTRAAYVDQQPAAYADAMRNTHAAEVSRAVLRGDPVPAAVLADYPDLTPAVEVAPKTAAELAGDLQDLRNVRPRSLDKTYGRNGPTPEQAAQHAEQTRVWDAAYRKASAAQELALERDNAAFRAKQSEPVQSTPAVRSPEADQQAAKADVAERRRKTAEAVRASVVKKTNANSAMVWQIIGPDGSPMSGPPGKYPGRELLGGTATMGDRGWPTKRDAESALAELNRKADEILGAAAPAPVAEPVAEVPPATQAAAILDAAPDPFADNYAALNGKTITQQVLVADTGKTATLRMDAGQALRDVNERETALLKLKACIGR